MTRSTLIDLLWLPLNALQLLATMVWSAFWISIALVVALASRRREPALWLARHVWAPGKVIGPSFSADEMPDVVDKIIKVYLASRHADESFLDTFDRIGIDPFKNRVYEGRAHGKARVAELEAA